MIPTINWRRMALVLPVLWFGLMIFGPGPIRAQSGSVEERLAAMEAEMGALRQQVADLRALTPTFIDFMPDFSERFHVMHLAGEIGDWAVAFHELLELKRMLGVGKLVDPKNGELLASFMAEPLSKINKAIEHENKNGFLQAMKETVVICNTCHTASGSAFIRVSLDHDKYVSIRHGHALEKSSMMGMKTHKH